MSRNFPWHCIIGVNRLSLQPFLYALVPCHQSAVTAAASIVMGTAASIYENSWCPTGVSFWAPLKLESLIATFDWAIEEICWLLDFCCLSLLLQTFGKRRLVEVCGPLLFSLGKGQLFLQWHHQSSSPLNLYPDTRRSQRGGSPTSCNP